MRKKVLGLLLIVMIAFAVTGCSLGGITTDPNGNGTQDVIDLHQVYTGIKAQIERYGQINNDIVLPTSQGNVTVSWSSNNPEIIDNQGHVNRPEQDTEVKLTCTLKGNGSEETYVITIVVKGIYTTIQDVVSGDNDRLYKVRATVVATGATGFLLYDNTGYVYIYCGNNYANDLTVGDIVELEGTRAEYKGTPQLTDSTYTKVGSETVDHPQANNVNIGELAANASTTVQYVQIEGVLQISGSYLNVAVAGITNAKGSLQTNLDVSEYANKRIIVNGYYLYTNGSNPLYANIIVTSIELSSDQSGINQEVQLSTIQAVKAGQLGSTYKVKATVIATGSTGFLLEDSTGLIFVYMGKDYAKDLSVGDEVEVQGATSEYRSTLQFGSSSYTKVGTKAVTHPTAKEIDAQKATSYITATTFTTELVKVKGTLRVNGSYLNLDIAGSDAKGSLITDINVSDFANQEVVVTGYYLYNTVSQGVTYINIITTSVERALASYTVVFADEDGTALSTTSYLEGDTVVIPTNPTKASDATYNYAFAGWDKEVATTCAGNATYTATYTQSYIDYKVEFKNSDGTVLSSTTYHYGDTVAIPSDPTRASDTAYDYTFAGWDKEVATTCAGNATYTATYTSTAIQTVPTTTSTIAQVKAGNLGDAYKIEATVVAISVGVVVVKDSTDYIILWLGETFNPSDLTVGDKLSITGNTTTHGVAIQFSVDANMKYEKIGTENVSDPTPAVLDKTSFEALDGSVNNVQYVKLEATLRVSGTNATYYNLEVEGSGKRGSIVYPTQAEATNLANLNGKKVTVEGYFVYATGSDTRYISIVAKHVEEVVATYTVEFKDYDGTVLSTATYHAGDAVVVPNEPIRPSDTANSYEFAGWDKTVVTPCAGNATYTATYTATPIQVTHTIASVEAKYQGTYYNSETVVVVAESSAVITIKATSASQTYTLYEDNDGIYFLDGEEIVRCTFGEYSVSNKFGEFVKADRPANIEVKYQGTYYAEGDIEVEVSASKFVLTGPSYPSKDYDLFIDQDENIYFMDGGKITCKFAEGIFNAGGAIFTREKPVVHTIATVNEELRGTYYDDEYIVVIDESNARVTIKANSLSQAYTLYEDNDGIYFLDGEEIVRCTFGEDTVTNKYGEFRRAGHLANVEAKYQGLYYDTYCTIDVSVSSFRVIQDDQSSDYDLRVNQYGQLYFEMNEMTFVCSFGSETFEIDGYSYNRNRQAVLPTTVWGTYYGEDVKIRVYETYLEITEGNNQPVSHTLLETPDGYIFYYLDNGGKRYCEFLPEVLTFVGGNSYNLGANQEDIDAVDLALSSLENFDGISIVKNISVPLVAYDCDITWSSTNVDVIQVYGNQLIVNVPNEETIVQMNIEASKGRATKQTSINIIVKTFVTVSELKDGTAEYDTFGNYAVKGVAVATYDNGFIIKDETGYIHAYDPKGTIYNNNVATSDVIIIRGTVTYYADPDNDIYTYWLCFTGDFDFSATGESENIGDVDYQELDDGTFDAICDSNDIRPVTIEGRVLIDDGNLYILSRNGYIQAILLNDVEYYSGFEFDNMIINGYAIYCDYKYVGIIPVSGELDLVHPSPSVKGTISEVLEAYVGTICQTSGVIVANGQTGLLVKDETGYIYVYISGGYNYNVLAPGREVVIIGGTAYYDGRVQFSDPTILAYGETEVTHPQATTLDADSFEELTNGEVVITYVTLGGVLQQNGNYLNLVVDGTEVVGSIILPLDNIDEYVDNKVAITGYYVYQTTSKGVKYAGFICTNMVVTQIIEKNYYSVELVYEESQATIETVPGELDSILEGNTVQLWVYANEGYRISNVSINGESAGCGDGTNFYYGFVIEANTEIEIVMVDAKFFAVAVNEEDAPSGKLIVTATAYNDSGKPISEDAEGTYENGVITAQFENINPVLVSVTELKEGETEFGGNDENILRDSFQFHISKNQPLLWDNKGTEDNPNSLAYAARVLAWLDSDYYYRNFYISATVKEIVTDDNMISYIVLTDENDNEVVAVEAFNRTGSIDYDANTLPFAADDEIVFIADFNTQKSTFERYLSNVRICTINGAELEDKVPLAVRPTNGFTEGATVFVSYRSGDYRILDRATIVDGVVTYMLEANPYNIKIAEFVLEEGQEEPEDWDNFIRISEQVYTTDETFKFHIKNETWSTKNSVVVNEDKSWTVGIVVTFNKALDDVNLEVEDIKIFGFLDGIYAEENYFEETVIDDPNNLEVVRDGNSFTISVTIPYSQIVKYTQEYYYSDLKYKGCVLLDYYLVLTNGEDDLSLRDNLFGTYSYYSRIADVMDTEGEGTLENPLTASDVLAIAQFLPNRMYTNEYYYIELEASNDATEDYCNFNFVVDEETLLVYGLSTIDGHRYGTRYNEVVGNPVKAGDTVLLYAQIQNYENLDTHELTYELKNSKLYKVNGETAEYELTVKHAGTLEDPFDITDVITIISGLNGRERQMTNNQYYVEAVVTEIAGPEYCNLNVTNGENDDTVLVYGLWNEDGTIHYGTKDGYSGTIPVNVGDKILLYGYLQHYYDTLEIPNAWLIEIIEAAE